MKLLWRKNKPKIRTPKSESHGYYTRVFHYEDLKRITEDFSKQNYIGKFQFGKLYRGCFDEEEVTVKIWEVSQTYQVYPGDNYWRIRDETDLLNYPELRQHPNMFKFVGKCIDGEHLAMVYRIKPLDTVSNLIPKDGFTWLKRIKVALEFARFLKYMHTPIPDHLPFLIRNIDAAHIIVDQDHNPKLIDFSMISGGIFTDKRFLLNQHVHGCYGYTDPHCDLQGEWSEKSDVFAFGVVLLGLITKRVCPVEDNLSDDALSVEWAQNEYKIKKSKLGYNKSKCSLVHPNIMSDPVFYSSDGPKITELAMKCVKYNPHKRPTMKQVVKCLQNLRCVSRHGENSHRTTYARKGHKEKFRGLQRLVFRKSYLMYSSLVRSSSPSLDGVRRKIEVGRTGMRNLIHTGDSNFNQLPICDIGKEHNGVKPLSYEQLKFYTSEFSEVNLIGTFQFGKVYRGKIGAQEVTVKIWQDTEYYIVYGGDNEDRLRDELNLFQHPRLVSHPNMVNLIGYCFEGEVLGVVYDLKPLDTVFNLLTRDCTFTWPQRIKVALGFARLLNFLHAEIPHEQYIVHNIDLAHIMLDEDYNPVLFDFGMITGGILPDDRRYYQSRYIAGCHGYIDLNYECTGRFPQCDVFSFGVVLLSLITNRVYTEKDTASPRVYHDEWAENEYMQKLSSPSFEESKFSLVLEDLALESSVYGASDGPEITRLAMDCMKEDLLVRPSMKQVVERLLNLHVVRSHADILSIGQTPSAKKPHH